MARNSSRLLRTLEQFNKSTNLLSKPHGNRFAISDKRFFSVSKRANMRFVQFTNGGMQQLGAQISLDSDIFDISAVDSSIPNSLVKFLNSEKDVRDKARR